MSSNLASSSSDDQLLPNWLNIAAIAVEAIVGTAVLALAILNIVVLCLCEVLHPNLRFILQLQSATIALYEFGRIGVMLFYANANSQIFQCFIFVNVASVFVRNFFCHFLFIERLLATVFYRRYENFMKPYLKVAIVVFLILFSVYNVFNYDQQSKMMNNVSLFIGLFGCFCEVMFIIYIGSYSERKYMKMVPKVNTYTLSEKYQIVENIRTSRQLGTTFICHFLNASVSLIIAIEVYYKWIVNSQVLNLFIVSTSACMSTLDGIIELTVITHHPALKRRAIGLLWNLFCCCKQNRVCDDASQQLPRNILGNSLISHVNTEEHLRIIQTNW